MNNWYITTPKGIDVGLAVERDLANLLWRQPTQAGEPTRDLGRFAGTESAEPKSESLMSFASGATSRMLAGLMSRWVDALAIGMIEARVREDDSSKCGSSESGLAWRSRYPCTYSHHHVAFLGSTTAS